GGARARDRVRAGQAEGAVRGPARRHQRRGGPRHPRRGEPSERDCGGHHARRGRQGSGARGMSILVGTDTKLVVTGLTGREGSFVHDMLRVYTHLKRGTTRLIGPNCPGVLSPGKANVGIIPAHFFSEGNVGLVSRSGTLTYQIGNELAQHGFGNSTIVGIGGDPIAGSHFIDIIELFEQDEQTELIVMCGEIGGDAEEQTAEYIAEYVSKPVLAYIA